MKIPAKLKHKPVIVVENYEQLDGKNAYQSEAKGLSLGLAQWNDRGKVDISAKVWRYTGEKWSRQSEELPLHRVLDLAILICHSRLFLLDKLDPSKEQGIQENTKIDCIELQGQGMKMELCQDNLFLEQDLRLFQQTLRQDEEMLGERFQVLARLLKDMGYCAPKA